MNKKYHKNWEEIRRLRVYTRYKYPITSIIKPTKLTWVLDLIWIILYIPALILLLWLYDTDQNSLLIIPLLVLSALFVIRAIRLWKLKSVFRTSAINTTDQKNNEK